MSFFDVNFLLVLIAAVLNFLLGWLWYCPSCFGKMWVESRQKKIEEMKATPWHFLGGLAVSFLTAWVLAVLFAHFGVSLNDGYKIAFLIWLGFYVTSGFSKVLWSDYHLKTFIIDVAYSLVSLLLMTTVLLYSR